MALLLIELVESFAIAILDALIDCEFPLNHCCLPQTTLPLIASPSILNCHLSFYSCLTSSSQNGSDRSTVSASYSCQLPMIPSFEGVGIKGLHNFEMSEYIG